jgi:hypothetical protein
MGIPDQDDRELGDDEDLNAPVPFTGACTDTLGLPSA